ncbi:MULTISPECIES: hypothetical protein [Kribbella]|uniref:Uncharacterized protein n=1 Tax=Kribbella karoonensis TaxID=324851 RepID=A0ABN2E403_9ACTN
MAERENIFVRSASAVRDEADGLQQLLGLEPIPNTEGALPDQYGLRGPATAVAGTVGYLVQPNGHVDPDAEPEDAQAFDSYPVEIDIWLGTRGPEQAAEARLVFDRLVAARPDVPMLLCHDLDLLVAAYRPGQGVHDFPEGTTVDTPDADEWRPWVAVDQEA